MTDLVPINPSRSADLRSQVTDSWTDVLVPVGDLARSVADTEFVPTTIRGSVPKVAATVLYARELGLPPMTGLQIVQVIEGRAGISAEGMRALILAAGHEIIVASSSREKAVVKGRRKGDPEWSTADFTIAEAARIMRHSKGKQAPLTDGANWRNYPADMLVARATTRLARWLFADVIRGMRSSEEIVDMGDEPPEGAPTATTAPVARQRPIPAPEPIEPAEAPQDESSTPVAVLPPLPEPAEAVPARDEATARVTRIVRHCARLGLADRDKRLARVSQLVGREINSTKELTDDEARDIEERLARTRTIDDLDTDDEE